MPAKGLEVESGLHRRYYDPEYTRMKVWLNEHPDSVHIRVVEPQATPVSFSVELGSPTHNNQSGGGSGVTSTVWKISVHEFEAELRATTQQSYPHLQARVIETRGRRKEAHLRIGEVYL